MSSDAERDREVELKLGIRPADISRFSSLDSLSHARLGQAEARQLFTVYYDTPDDALRKAGLSLRLRHEGRQRIQSVKGTACDDSLAAERLENEVVLNGTGPDIDHISDPALRAKVTEITAGAPLAPRFETQVLRRTRHAKTQAGDEIEFVVDVGKIRAAHVDRPIAEIELELKSGSRCALYAMARALNEEAPLRVLTLTKADRGYALLGAPGPEPQKAKTLRFPRNATAGEALAEILRACLSHLMANEPAVLERQDAEALHQMRVALRRLRSALSLYRGMTAPFAWAEEARFFARTLGPARDFDVFKDELMAPVADAFPGEPAFRILAEAVEKARRVAWSDVETALSSARYTNFVLDLAESADARPWLSADGTRFDVPARVFASDRLSRQLAKTVKRARKLRRHDVAAAHELRKRLKKLRYGADFFACVYAEGAMDRFTKRLGKLQTAFGIFNDAATAARLVDTLIAKNPDHLETLAWAGGLVAGWHRSRSEEALRSGAKGIGSLPARAPFWQEA